MTCPNDINTLDSQDAGLKEIFGDNFTDATVPIGEAPKEKRQSAANTTHAAKAAHKPTNDPTKVFKDCTEWEPVKKRNQMDDLRDCAKTTVLFGGLNVLIWYWQIAGLMDESIALPSMLVCAALAGFGIGKTAVRGSR